MITAQSRQVVFHGLPEIPLEQIDSSAIRFSGLSEYVTVGVPRLLDQLQDQGYVHAQVDSITIPQDGIQPVHVYIQPDSRVHSLIINGIPTDSVNDVDQIQISGDLNASASYWNKQLSYTLAQFANDGYPLVQWRATDIGFQNGHLKIKGSIDPESPIILDTMIVRTSGETHAETFIREIRIPPGSLYRERDIQRARRQIQRFGFVEEVSKPSLFFTPANKYGLLWEIVEQKANTFNGIIGYVPATTSRDGYFTGQLQFDFVNLFGTARELHIYWEKRDVITQEMALGYTEPWVGGWPIHVTAGFEQLVQDSTYIQRETSAELGYQVNWRWNLFGRLGTNTVISTPSGRTLYGLRSYSRIDYSAGIQFSTLDNPRNPTAGIIFENSIARRTGIQGIDGPLQTLDFRVQGVRTLIGPHVISVAAEANNILSPPDSLQISELYRFGGASSLRGYDESAFLGTTIGWINLEYRLVFEKNSRFLTFFDYGYWERSSESGVQSNGNYSYGVGLRLQTAVGQLGVDYGIPGEADWQNGRIHVRYINYF